MKFTIISSIIGLSLIIGAVIISNNNTDGSLDNVSIIDGKQIITMTARGGYSPRRSIAKAKIPTLLRIQTKGTFDCSSIIRIPDLNIYQNLPSSGNTEIDLGIPQIGLLRGSCGMGMYFFEINFQS
ncbi:MAG: hypothetical protein HYT62_03470 [Candidatus Yanofskybacteria bacterium]|nr:hypothetical protein [Candidatus Yanofskybacteria bacterium]